MIRHLAELSALLLCFAVGVGLLAAFGIGLLWIWGKRPDEDSTLEDEYRRVESAGALVSDLAWICAHPESPYAQERPGLYNWATREPMIWGRS